MEDTYLLITAGNTFLSIEFIITIKPDVPLSSYMGLMGSGHPISSDHGNPYNGAIDHFETIPQFVHVLPKFWPLKWCESRIISEDLGIIVGISTKTGELLLEYALQDANLEWTPKKSWSTRILIMEYGNITIPGIQKPGGAPPLNRWNRSHLSESGWWF